MQKDFTCLNVPKPTVVRAKELSLAVGGFKQYFCVGKAIGFALANLDSFKKFCYEGDIANED